MAAEALFTYILYYFYQNKDNLNNYRYLKYQIEINFDPSFTFHK